MTASASIAIATVFDLLVWYFAKELVIFDKKKGITEEKKEEGGDENGVVTVKNISNGL